MNETGARLIDSMALVYRRLDQHPNVAAQRLRGLRRRGAPRGQPALQL